MLKISTEYRKGVLFIRLIGRLDNAGYLDDIKQMIDELGIHCMVLNLTKVNGVSLESINHIMNYNQEILKKKKKMFICDASNIRNRLFKNMIPNISCEIDAFSLI